VRRARAVWLKTAAACEASAASRFCAATTGPQVKVNGGSYHNTHLLLKTQRGGLLRPEHANESAWVGPQDHP